MLACPVPAVALTFCGGPGAPTTTRFDVAAGPVPALLLAVTWNVYDTPFVSPEIVVPKVDPPTWTGVPAVFPL